MRECVTFNLLNWLDIKLPCKYLYLYPQTNATPCLNHRIISVIHGSEYRDMSAQVAENK